MLHRCSFFTFQTLKIHLEQYNEAHGMASTITTPERLVSGGLSGLVAQSSTWVPHLSSPCRNRVTASNDYGFALVVGTRWTL